MGPSRPLKLREAKACEEDARLVMQWRNDPGTLAMSYHSQPKVWEGFWPEFKREYFTVPRTSPLFLLSEGEPVAFLRFRPIDYAQFPAEHSCEISINVAPDHRGKGLGVLALHAAASYLAERDYQFVIADVKLDNLASHRIFEKAGYRAHAQMNHQGAAITRYVYSVPNPSGISGTTTRSG